MPMKMEQIECSETSAYINQTPGNHPKENTQQIYTVSFHNTFLYIFWLYIATFRKNSLTKELYADVDTHHHHHHIHSINRFQKLQPILLHQLIKT